MLRVEGSGSWRGWCARAVRFLVGGVVHNSATNFTNLHEWEVLVEPRWGTWRGGGFPSGGRRKRQPPAVLGNAVGVCGEIGSTKVWKGQGLRVKSQGEGNRKLLLNLVGVSGVGGFATGGGGRAMLRLWWVTLLAYGGSDAGQEKLMGFRPRQLRLGRSVRSESDAGGAGQRCFA